MTDTMEQLPAVRDNGEVRRVTPINESIDRKNVGSIQIRDDQGGVSFSNMIELMDFAKLMAVSQTAVPKHLRGNPGACMAVCIQAIEWRMSPFAVANKSYSVNDRLAYESAIYHAVVGKRAPIKGRIKMEFTGAGPKRVCRVWASLADGSGDVEYESPETGNIKPKNSPLWINDPDQQLFYFSVRAWSRRHFPDVMMGLYTIDEIQDNPPEQQAQAAELDDRIAKARAAKQQQAAQRDDDPSPDAQTEPQGDDAPQAEVQTDPPADDSPQAPPAQDESQATFPECPAKELPHLEFVAVVAGLCGMNVDDTMKAIKLTLVKPTWHAVSREGQVAWWAKFAAGEKKGLIPLK